MATIVATASGGTRLWSSVDTWIGAAIPTAADSVQIPLAAGNVTIDTGAVCRGLDCTTYTGTLTHNAGATLTIGDGTAALSNIALRLAAGMTYTLGHGITSTIAFISTSTTVQTVDFAGKTSGAVTYNAASNGSWQMTGAHNAGSSTTVTLTKGTLDVNAQTCSWGLFNTSNSNTRSLTLGAAAITITGASSTAWDISTTTNLTLSAASSAITFTGSSATFHGGSSKVYGTVSMTGDFTQTWSGTGVVAAAFAATGNPTALTVNGAKTVTGTFTLAGNSVTTRLLVQSSTVGTAVTITNTGATHTWSNVDFMDIDLVTAFDASAITGGSGNCGGNSNITFTTAATQTWQGTTGGNWNSAAKWTSRVPLPQDNVVINAAFSASQTVTANMNRLGKDIDWTGATGTPAWALSAPAGFNDIYGSLTLISGMGAITGGAVTLRGRGTHTITSAGKTFPWAMSTTTPGGTYTLQDALAAVGGLTIANGVFVANGFNVTALTVISNGTATRTVTMGSGTWTLTQTTATTVWNFGTVTGLTFSGASATIAVTGTSANTKTFAGGGLTYGTLTYTVAGSTGPLVVTGANTFGTVNFSDVTNARTLTLPAATTTTVTTFNVNGTTGKLMTVQSSSAGSAATLSKASGTVSVDYLSLKDSAATGGAAFYAGANSTNVSGNTGWTFTAPPSVVALTPATVTLTAQTLTPVPTMSTVALTPAALTLTGQALTATPGVVTVALTPAALNLAATATTPTPGVVTVALTPATVSLTAQALAAVPGAVTVTLAAATVTLTTVPLTAVPGIVTVALAPAALALTARPLTAVPGAVTVVLTPAALTFTARVLAATPGPATVALTAAVLTFAARTLNPAPGTVTVALTPAGLTFTAIPLNPTTPTQAVTLTPATLALTAVALAAQVWRPGTLVATSTPTAILVATTVTGV